MTGTSTADWLVEIAGPPTRTPVPYLVPHAGAGVGAVLALGRALAGDLDPVAVRLPGREALLDHPPVADLTTAADGLAERITAHAAGRPVVLYGHSSGAILAYEAARRLAAGQLALLVVSAQQAPGRPPGRETSSWRLPTGEFFARVVADGYLPPELLADPDLLALVEPALRADYRAVDRHMRELGEPEPVPAPVITVRAEDDATVAVDDLVAWRAVTSDHRVVSVPGGHNLLRDQPHRLAAVIREGVQRVTGTAETPIGAPVDRSPDNA
ncbi:thioesterase II family protein [Saccharothrix obliqua]|uniref:thioesterase II family protein n=1 Tax=Saccharothrix obliqua TaxID=2861747 RepID=UPI001C5E9449|nr:alpha/beta fold hydrolase [Saccharothrix obliqua]MBW4718812.1 alpha/beta fold hydrolase [Saccharothrix obliqua]